MEEACCSFLQQVIKNKHPYLPFSGRWRLVFWPLNAKSLICPLGLQRAVQAPMSSFGKRGIIIGSVSSVSCLSGSLKRPKKRMVTSFLYC